MFESEPPQNVEWVSIERAKRIMGLSLVELSNAVAWGYLRSDQARQFISYRSIIELCDVLRVQYGIKDRRKTLKSPSDRHSDEDLLPFPMSDAVTLAEAGKLLGLDRDEVERLCSRGQIDDYRVTVGGVLRVSRSSVAAFLDRRRELAQAEWLTFDEAAELLDTSRSSINYLASVGTIKLDTTRTKISGKSLANYARPGRY